MVPLVSAYLSEYIVDLALHGGKCHDHQLLLVHVPQMQLELKNCNVPTDQSKHKKIKNLYEGNKNEK
jgi:hypothetical protein